MKINASTKSLVERLCDFKIYAISVLSFIGSVCTPDNATLKVENHALQCTTAGPYNAITSSLLQLGSICGLGPDLIGIHSISLAARYRVAACSSTLRRGLEKVNEARGHNCTPLSALSPAWEQELLFLFMTFHTANAFDIVCPKTVNNDGMWRGEMKCIGPRARNADLWILIWEEQHRVHQEGILVEVEHVKAHRSKEEIQQMSLTTEGYEKADEEQCRGLGPDCEELLPNTKEEWTSVNKTCGSKEKHRVEWCAAANKHRCMKCGKAANT